MTAERLLRLYPRAWRERYGAELLDLTGSGPLRAPQVLDIVSGAVDAWLSADVRRAAGTSLAATGAGGAKMIKSLTACGRTEATTRDALIGAGVILVATFAFTLLAVLARRNGWVGAADIAEDYGFSVALALSMPFWLMKGQPWRAQVAIIGGMLAVLLMIGLLL